MAYPKPCTYTGIKDECRLMYVIVSLQMRGCRKCRLRIRLKALEVAILLMI